jgi:hypothetical protein
VAFLQGVFAIFGVQNVVNWLVKRGGVVVKVWPETTANRPRKIRHIFAHFFNFFATIHRMTPQWSW